MIKGIAFALAACCVWGLIFVVPGFMGDFSATEVALGRYSFYGILSTAIFLRQWLRGSCRYPKAIWIKALYFSFAATFFYYINLVLALRYSTPAIAALILGICPITTALYGNSKKKEVSYRSLLLPSLLILVGLAFINVPHILQHATPTGYLLGLFCSTLSLSAWSWYVVANVEFFKQHPEVQCSDWSTLIGVSTVFWAALCYAILQLFFVEELHIGSYALSSPEMQHFLIGSLILGLACSWLGAYLWNKASGHLPVSLAGQLTIFETIFGLIFFYALEQKIPPQFELVGIVFLLGAVIYGIRSTPQLPAGA